MSNPGYHRLLGNVGWLSVGELFNRAAGLFIALYLARVLGPKWYGIVGSAIAVYSCFAVLVQAGLEPAGIREISRNPTNAQAVFTQNSSLRLLLALVTFVTLLAASPFLAEALSVPWWLLVIYAGCFFPTALSATWVLRGLEEMRLVAIAIASQRVLIAIGIVLFIREPRADLPYVALIEVAVMVLISAWTIQRVRSIWGGLSHDLGLRYWQALMREALPIVGSRLLMLVYSNGDILLLGILTGPVTAGVFLVAQKLTITVWQLATVFLIASFPEVSRRVEKDKQAAISLQADVLRYLLVISIPFVVTAIIFAKPMVVFLFGQAYVQAAVVLTVLALCLPVSFAVGCLRQLLFAAACPGKAFTGYLFGTSVHIALAILWIPLAGPTGAALACFTGEVFVLLTLVFFVLRQLQVSLWLPRAFSPIAAGVVLGLVISALLPANIFVLTIVGIIIYTALLFMFGSINKVEVLAVITKFHGLLKRR